MNKGEDVNTATSLLSGYSGPSSDAHLERMVLTADMPALVFQAMKPVISNAAAQTLLGYTRDDLAETPALSLLHPDVRESVVKRATELASGTTLFPAFSTRFLTRTGEEIPVQVTVLPSRWRGEPAFLVFIKDESKELALQRELETMQRLQSLGTLAGGIAHDFNNLLMVIQGSVDLMLQGVGESDAHYEGLKLIETQVQNGAWLTRQLLGYARQKKHQVEQTDFAALVDTTAGTFARTRKDIEIHKRLDAATCAIRADRGAIEQVVMNLLINCGDAMPAGGDIYLLIDTTTAACIRYCREPDGHREFVHLRISDTGSGVDEKDIDRVFEPFFTTKGMGRGTGLGLSAAYGILKSHGGFIELSSEAGHGTTVDVFLPTVSQVAERPQSGGERRHDGAGNELILMVDDEPMLLQLGERMLHRLGYRVVTAKGGEQAISALQRHRGEVDLVILDMIMPGMSGGETCRRLRELDPDIKVILASGYSRESQASEMHELGCAGFLQKPYNIQVLQSYLGEILSRMPSHQEDRRQAIQVANNQPRQ